MIISSLPTGAGLPPNTSPVASPRTGLICWRKWNRAISQR